MSTHRVNTITNVAGTGPTQGITPAASSFSKDLVTTDWVPGIPSWTALTLQNGWVIYDSPAPRYRKWLNNLVEVQGRIRNGTNASLTIVASLPAGYRTSRSLLLPVANGTSATTIIFIEATNGNIRVAGTPSNVDLSLDLLFMADQ